MLKRPQVMRTKMKGKTITKTPANRIEICDIKRRSETSTDEAPSQERPRGTVVCSLRGADAPGAGLFVALGISTCSGGEANVRRNLGQQRPLRTNEIISSNRLYAPAHVMAWIVWATLE